MFTIKQAAQLTGVSEHTLRAWERRYDVISTARTPSGYRLYDDAAVARIREMRALVDEGIPPRDASVEVASRHPVSRDTPAAPPDFGDLIDALAALDAGRVKRIVDQQFAVRSYESVVDDWLMPMLIEVGRAWARKRISVAGEHLVANIVLRRLSAAFEAAGPNPARSPVIVGGPKGISHELGLLAFAVALRRTGTSTVYLGGDVPVDAWVDAVRTTAAVGSVTSVPRRADAPRVVALAERLHAYDPAARVLVGGSFQHLATHGCIPLGHNVTLAARTVADIVAGS
jgi:methanogenic corrinoid protein MtbC1